MQSKWKDNIIGNAFKNFEKGEVIILSAFVLIIILTLGNRILNSYAGGVAVPEIVTNINVSSISGFIVINEIAYFGLDDGVSGRELWKSDGTAPGTEMVKDINPEGNDSIPINPFLVEMNGVLYFSADDGTNGSELWKSDGTASGTEMVIDINMSGNSSPSNLINLNGVLYFSVTGTGGTSELWKSDGTASGTEMIKIFNVPIENPGIDNMVSMGSDLFFTVTDDTHGTEVWKSDGTEVGTVMVKDIDVGGGNVPDNLININGVLYFVMGDGSNGVELWKSDGTEEGTVMVKDIYTGVNASNPTNFTNVNGTLFFSAYDGVNGVNSLWKSDGTASGTEMVIASPNEDGNSLLSNFTNVNGTLYFSANNRFINYQELWKSDGTASGTMMVKDINVGAESDPANLINVNGILYFTADNGTNGRELWKSDGTEEGTVMVVDIRAGDASYSNFFSVGSTLYFFADDGTNGKELWKLSPSIPNTLTYIAGENGYISGSSTQVVEGGGDGSIVYAVANDGYHFVEWSDTTTTNPRVDLDTQNDITITAIFATGSIPVMVKDINNSAPGFASNPESFLSIEGTLYFISNDGIHGKELWKSDGTPEGTIMVKDIYSGSSDSSVSSLTDVDGILYFSADDGINGVELWKSDGTEEGTIMIKDIYLGISGSGVKSIVNLNGIVYFFAYDETNDSLWKSDGTEVGTVIVKNISFDSMINVGNVLYFNGYNEVYGSELWKSDGTEVGTVIVKDAAPGEASTDIRYLRKINNILLFSANFGDDEMLWKSDGTEAGTVMLKNISQDEYYFNLNSVLYFNAYDGVYGSELWKSDGTEVGTIMVKDIRPGSEGSSPGIFSSVGNTLYFQANDGVNGSELWKSDGTAEGTVLVKDISVGDPNGGLAWNSNTVRVGNDIYFAGYDAVYSIQLWKSDGTEAGTVMEYDFINSDFSTSNFININGTLFFTRDDLTGYRMELWKYTPPQSNYNLVYSVESNGTLSGSTTQVITSGGNGTAVTAIADEGYHFVKWSDDVTDNPRTDTNVTGNISVTANFEIGTTTSNSTSATPSFTSSGSYFINLLLTTTYNDLIKKEEKSNTNSTTTQNNTPSISTTTLDITLTNPILARINTESTFTAPVSNKVSGVSKKKEKHTISTLSVNDYTKTVTVEIRSKPQILNIKLGETIRVDLNNDTVPDVSVELTTIHNNNKPELVVRSLLQEIKTIPLTTKIKVATTTYVFTRDYKVGTINKEVQELQKFLNANGFIVKPKGYGSKGKESDLFGFYTSQSIKKFQKANNIYPATGFFGPVTREYINKNFVNISN
jgi:ELWxxDGT repeat protein